MERRRDALVGAVTALRPQESVELFAEAVDPADVDVLVAALAKLPELDREVVQLSVWHDMDASEVGTVVGLTAGNYE